MPPKRLPSSPGTRSRQEVLLALALLALPFAGRALRESLAAAESSVARVPTENTTAGGATFLPADPQASVQELPPLTPAHPNKPQPPSGHNLLATQQAPTLWHHAPTPPGLPEDAPKEVPARKNPPVELGEDKGKLAEPPEPVSAEPTPPWYSVHGQGTIVTQIHDRFRSPYVGPLSLLPVEPAATTETATLFLDGRFWQGGEIVFNPEISGGRGFSGTTGIAGFPNGEATRVGAVEPTPYIARLFVRQTWGLDGERLKIEDGPNQIAGTYDVNRIALTVGKLSATDIADANRYSHDPRSQFLPWSIMYDGAWDYPANVRGYTYGVALEFNTVFWALHYGIFAEPAVANGAPLDPHFLKANGQILELEERWDLDTHPGKLREWVSLNHAHMGKYQEALDEMPTNPDVTLTRAYRFKYGFGGNIEQELTRDLGVFLKGGWNDGQTESWAFTAIDATLATGLLYNGRLWKRPQDTVGLAACVNWLSAEHRKYLAAGGLDFIIGDGRLNYAPEEILEVYYDWQLRKGIFVTLEGQGVDHPAYNQDRGPVAIGSLRVHFEY